jgi:hypothetical protein
VSYFSLHIPFKTSFSLRQILGAETSVRVCANYSSPVSLQDKGFTNPSILMWENTHRDTVHITGEFLQLFVSDYPSWKREENAIPSRSMSPPRTRKCTRFYKLEPSVTHSSTHPPNQPTNQPTNQLTRERNNHQLSTYTKKMFSWRIFLVHFASHPIYKRKTKSVIVSCCDFRWHDVQTNTRKNTCNYNIYVYVKVKVKYIVEKAMKAQRRSRGIDLLFL